MKEQAPFQLTDRSMSRRDVLRSVGGGFGLVGLAGALGTSLPAASIDHAASPLTPKRPHFPARAKHVIYLFLSGGLSQVDSFDYKPTLDKYDDKPLPYDLPLTQFATGNLMRSPFTFKQCGQNGLWVSELFPNVREIIDEFCLIRSMHTDVPNHPPSQWMMNCGFSLPGRPSMGSWVTYGLGTENQNLPAFIVLGPGGDVSRWSSGFLPALYQGTHVSTLESDPQKQVEYLSNPRLDKSQQRRQLDLVRRMNERLLGDLHTAHKRRKAVRRGAETQWVCLPVLDLPNRIQPQSPI